MVQLVIFTAMPELCKYCSINTVIGRYLIFSFLCNDNFCNLYEINLVYLCIVCLFLFVLFGMNHFLCPLFDIHDIKNLKILGYLLTSARPLDPLPFS